MSEVTNEKLVLSALIKNKDYLSKFLPYISEDYFEDLSERKVFNLIKSYAGKYSASPDSSTLLVSAKNDRSIDEDFRDKVLMEIKDTLSIVPTENFEFLKETTEKWCRERAVYNALQDAISVYQGENKKLSIAAVPDLLSKAISINFEQHIGQDYWNDVDKRWDFYVNPESRIPFLIDVLNQITNGGVPRKTANCIVSGTNVGKSFSLVSLGADYIRQGLNVLYFTMEMREEIVGQRYDANLLNVDMNKISEIGKEKYFNRIESLKSKSYGKLVVKEFPPSTASTLNFKQVIDDLKMKKGFVPDVIIVDYLQIVASYRLPPSSGSYYIMKAVSEELRALAVETNTVLWTATQLNRGQMVATDVDLTGISESAGISHTMDFMLALIRTDELDQLGQLIAKQLKSRYANKSSKSTFALGATLETQRLYGLEDDKSDKLTQMDSVVMTDQKELRNKFMSFN